MKLTTAEEQLMHFVWKHQRVILKDLIASYEDPRPAKTTVATLIKKLIDKKYVAYEEVGSTRIYYPLIEKETYFSGQVQTMIQQFFDNSTSAFASFFAKDASLTKKQLEELRDIINDELKK